MSASQQKPKMEMGLAVAGAANPPVTSVFERIRRLSLKSISPAAMGKIPKPEPEEPEGEEKPKKPITDVEEAIGLRLIAIYNDTEGPTETFEYMDPRSTPTLIRLLKKDGAVGFNGPYAKEKATRPSFVLRADFPTYDQCLQICYKYSSWALRTSHPTKNAKAMRIRPQNPADPYPKKWLH